MSVLLSSCIISRTPQFVVYDPPEDKEGISCTTQCEYAKNNCFRLCNKQAEECRVQESYHNTVNNIVGFVGNAVCGSVGCYPRETRKQECIRSRNECTSQCGTDHICSFKCATDYRSCYSTSNDIYSGFRLDCFPSSTKSLCDTSRCDGTCRDDYAACFVDCGGTIRVVTPEQQYMTE
ncbi:hypothetical protein PGW94_04185 [Candidatus Anaplasma sp. TIGMIC]|nr:hypothetical protein [Candidatus Anaplasma sp. TIGMIC]